MARRTLSLLTRPGCSLCEKALPHLQRASRWLALDLTVTDIAKHPELESRYHLRIPVVVDSRGRVLAEGSIGVAAAWWAAIRARSRA